MFHEINHPAIYWGIGITMTMDTSMAPQKSPAPRHILRSKRFMAALVSLDPMLRAGGSHKRFLSLAFTLLFTV
jgi:hypothetical protein